MLMEFKYRAMQTWVRSLRLWSWSEAEAKPCEALTGSQSQSFDFLTPQSWSWSRSRSFACFKSRCWSWIWSLGVWQLFKKNLVWPYSLDIHWNLGKLCWPKWFESWNCWHHQFLGPQRQSRRFGLFRSRSRSFCEVTKLKRLRTHVWSYVTGLRFSINLDGQENDLNQG